MGVDELKLGKMYWRVLRPKNSKPYVVRILILSRPKLHEKVNSLFVDALIFLDSEHVKSGTYISKMFLEDCNIPENNYSQNRVFASYSEACAYAVKQVKPKR